MSKGRSKAPSQRQLRVGEELRHALSTLLERGDIHDPDVQGIPVTVTEVRASPDLKNATVFFMPLGGDAEVLTRVGEGLKRAAPFLRHKLAEKVLLRHAPRLKFLADTSFDTADHIDHLLRAPSVSRDLQGPKPADDANFPEDDADGA